MLGCYLCGGGRRRRLGAAVVGSKDGASLWIEDPYKPSSDARRHSYNPCSIGWVF